MIEHLDWLGRQRLPVILQTEVAECSLACLAMVASFHGHEVDLATLRKQFSLSLKGVNLEQFVNMAARLRLQSRPLRLEPNELPLLATPCVLHWDLNHFVVLRQAKRDEVVIHDPATGRRTLSHDELSKHFTGIALEVTPNVDFQRRKASTSPLSLSRLAGQMSGVKSALLQILLLSLALQVFALVTPMLMQGVMDHVLVAADRDLLTVIILGFGLLLLSQIALTQFRNWSTLYLSTRMGLQWVGGVVGHLLRLPMGSLRNDTWATLPLVSAQ